MNLNHLADWSVSKKEGINFDESSLITYYRGNNYFDTSYLMNSNLLKRVNEQRNLGFEYQDSFQFDKHVENTVNKAFKVLGFVIISSQQLKIFTIIQFHKALVKPILLYNSQV